MEHYRDGIQKWHSTLRERGIRTGDSKCFCTLQIYFRPTGEQLRIAIIFRNSSIKHWGQQAFLYFTDLFQTNWRAALHSHHFQGTGSSN